MIHVADTHAIVWFLTGQRRRVSPAAARVFKRAERGADEIRLSAVSLFEIALLFERGRLRAGSWTSWFEAALQLPGLTIATVNAQTVEHASQLRSLVDPFDRLIVGTALEIGAPLITADDRIASSRLVNVVW